MSDLHASDPTSDSGNVDYFQWRPVSPRYITALRITASVYYMMFIAGVMAIHIVSGLSNSSWAGVHGVAITLAWLVVVFLWAPRRVAHTRYLLRDLDISVEKGYLWRDTISLAINRIQHLEVTQGPIERILGISKLILYTAGGFQSDLKLPGLESKVAKQLKAHLLNKVSTEDTDEEIL